MTVQERILALRVLEDVERDPAYAKRLGVSVKLKPVLNEKERRKQYETNQHIEFGTEGKN